MTNRPWFGKSAAPVASIAATVCVLLCSAGLAWAEEAAPPSSDGRAVGIFCGAILLALVLSSLYLYLLWAAGAAVHALGLTGDMMRTMVESPAIVGDLLLGGLVFAVVRRNAPASLAYAAMAL